MADIAIYVQSEYAKKAYAVESYNVRAWPGMELIKDVIIRAGHEVDYCGAATVQDYKIILMSITSPIDWYSFISERVTWKPGKYTVVVGGAGNLNIRPVLPFADIFVFGRGENIIIPLIQETLKGNKYDHPAVAYACDFSPEKTYRIEQATECYPYPVTLANGKEWKETAIGCQRKCLFCGYSWQRKHIGGLQRESGSAKGLWVNTDELTFFDFDVYDWEHYPFEGSSLILGLDGFSERLRVACNKPITRNMLVGFLRGMISRVAKYGQHFRHIKLYNLCGLPGENQDDWREFLEDFIRADGEGAMGDKSFWIQLHLTPFDATPATPAAVWPMRYFDYRGYVEKSPLRDRHYPNSVYWIYNGRNISATFTHSTGGLPTTILWALMCRGIEQDTDNVRLLSASRTFQNANSKTRLATLEKYLDIDRLFGAYTWENVPTRYLGTYVPNSGLAKLSDRGRYVTF